MNNGVKAEDTAADGGSPKLHDLAVAHLLSRLREQEIAEEYLSELGEALQSRIKLGGEAPGRHLIALLAERLKTAPPWPVGEERPLIVPFLGPTGVGKTTTIAKLAASYALQLGFRVGLVTADTYRIAAVEQLRIYADIIGIPLEVVYSPDEMGPALQRLSDKDLILVDTAGRSPHHRGQMEELKALLQAADSPHGHLVVSATTRYADLARITDLFLACAPVEALVITKLDETGTYGLLYNIVQRTGSAFGLCHPRARSARRHRDGRCREAGPAHRGGGDVRDQAAVLRRMVQRRTPFTRVIAVTSGKGGWAKATSPLTWASAWRSWGARPAILDGDLGLANVSILFGMNPPYDLRDVLSGRQRISEIAVSGPGGVLLWPEVRACMRSPTRPPSSWIIFWPL